MLATRLSVLCHRRLASATALFQIKQSNARINNKVTDVDVPHDCSKILVKVEMASVNTVDSRMILGKIRPKQFPHVPGCDFSGVVLESSSSNIPVGSRVVGAGHGIGVDCFGGYAGVVSAPECCIQVLPEHISTQQAATIGYTGLLAAVASMSLGDVSQRKIAVAGADTPYGLISTLLLSKMGAEVIALTKDLEHSEMIKKYGASVVVDSNMYLNSTPQHVSKAKWSGFIDCNGGEYTGRVIEDMKIGSKGIVLDHSTGDLAHIPLSSVIARGVTLTGLTLQSSAMHPAITSDKIREAWMLTFDKLTKTDLTPAAIMSLSNVIDVASKMHSGAIKERVVVKL